MKSENIEYYIRTVDLLCPLCERNQWYETDVLDIFFQQHFFEREDDYHTEFEQACSSLKPIDEPVAMGGTYGDGIYAVMETVMRFNDKYGGSLDEIYFALRDIKEYGYLLRNAVTDSHYNALEFPPIVERRLCKKLKVRYINA